MSRRFLPSASEPSTRARRTVPPAPWSLLVLLAAMDAVVALVDFVVRPLLASPPDPQAALRGGVVLAILGVAAAQLVRPRGDAHPAPAAPSGASAAPTATDVLLACLANLPAGTADTPAVLAVHVGDPLVEVFWDGPSPPPPTPWRPSATGWVWDAERSELALSRPVDRRAWALLLAAGATPSGTLWLNLAGFRVTALAGDDAAVTRRAAAIVQALRRRAAAGAVELLVLDEPGARPATHDEATVEEAMATLWRRTARRRAEAGLAPRARRRIRVPEPLVVVAAAHPDLKRLLAAARVHPDTTVVAIGDLETADLRLRCAAGQMTVPFLGDVPVRVADPAPPPEPATGSKPRATDEPPDSPPDDPLRAEEAAETVEVRILGPVEVRGATGALAGKSLELAVYLACHPDGVPDEQIRAALWPHRPPAPATWAHRVSVTRRALGADADGGPRLPRFRHHVGRLAPSVRTDVSRLDAALAECRETTRPTTADALATLLDEVRGPPFDAPRGYGWAHQERHAQRAQQTVIDAAHYLADRAIQAGDWEGAVWAIERGLRACPASDVLLEDREHARAIGGVSSGALATRALRDALRDLDPELGLTVPDPGSSRVTVVES